MENATIQAELNKACWTTGISRSALFFRAAIAIVLGGLLVAAPLATIQIITVCIGILMVFNAGSLFTDTFKLKGGAFWLSIIYASSLTLLGIFAILEPLRIDLLWIYILAVWQLLTGISGISSALSKHTPYRGIALLSGSISLMVAIVLILWPFSGLAALWILGLFLMIFGGFLIGCALTIRKV